VVLGGGVSGRHGWAGQRLDAPDLQGLVEVHLHGPGGLGDLQVAHAAPEGGGGGESRLPHAAWRGGGERGRRSLNQVLHAFCIILYAFWMTCCSSVYALVCVSTVYVHVYIYIYIYVCVCLSVCEGLCIYCVYIHTVCVCVCVCVHLCLKLA